VSAPIELALAPTVLETSAIDRTFARMLVRRLAPAREAAREAARIDIDAVRALDPLLYHTALLVSAERAQGNSCVALERWADRTVAEHDGAAPFTFPALDDWLAALQVSGACESDGDAEHEARSEEPVAPTRSTAAPSRDALERAPLVLRATRLYLTRFAAAEQRVATQLRARMGVARSVPMTPLFDRLFPAHATDGQREAAAAALAQPLVFITGGPGTGKTTMAAKLLALLLEQDPSQRVALAAPTGRAAARLGESMTAAVQREQLPAPVAEHLPRTGVTLHRLLGYRPWSDRFTHEAAWPLPDDIVVVDEASMVDVLLMDALLAAVRPDARLIVLGDPDQLASVDTGCVLGDIVRAAGAPGAPDALRRLVATLTVSHRFGQRPGIGALATAAGRGDADAVVHTLSTVTSGDVSWRPQRGGSVGSWLEPVRAPLETYLASQSPAGALEALGRFRVLCALRDGEAGVQGLNAAIERWLQRRGLPVSGWYPHRPVLITQNDPATQLFNGDVGTTIIEDGEPLVYFEGPNGPRAIAPARLPAHETAWAMTVHKAQGSEFDHVLVVLPENDSRLLTRELLYTAVTRARQHLHLVGSEAIVRLTVRRSVDRQSGLVERLRERLATTRASRA
jgi:exodeoxyribonuclease V alpha subunit